MKLDIKQIVFWMLALQGVAASVAVVAVRNVVHAALALVAALIAAAGLFLLFGAEFVGLTQILVYVGAVAVLFLFGIMLTSARPSATRVDNEQRGIAAAVAVAVFAVLGWGIWSAFGTNEMKLDVSFETRALGQDLFTTWVLPFEAVSMLLLAALIGAIVLARKD